MADNKNWDNLEGDPKEVERLKSVIDKIENVPIKLSAKSRRNLYLSTREQIERDNPEVLPDFDRLHNGRHHEYPFLHEFRLGWLCGREYERENALLSEPALDNEKVDAVLQASARINELEDLLTTLEKCSDCRSNNNGFCGMYKISLDVMGALRCNWYIRKETVDQYIERNYIERLR